MSKLIIIAASWNIVFFLGCAILLVVKYRERKQEKIQEQQMLQKYRKY